MLLAFLAEVFIEVFAEALFELGFYSLAEVLNRRRKRNPLLASIGYFLWGGIIGGVTLLVFPMHMIKHPSLRVLNLFISPLIAGLAMSGIGALRRRKGQELLRIDSFFYGALFAFGLAMVRFLCAA